jgi:hypothetical protein
MVRGIIRRESVPVVLLILGWKEDRTCGIADWINEYQREVCKLE